MEAVVEHVREVQGMLRSVCENIADSWQRERKPNEDFFKIGTNLAEKPRCGEVLDFDTKDENGVRVTMEGQLLDAVLALDGSGSIAATAQGYGGVGKSCALRGIAHHLGIKDRFWGGILFVTLGQEAGEESLQDHLRWMVQVTGGNEKAKEVAAAETLETAVRATGTWFSEYPCLFLFDDVWCGKTLTRASINLLRGIVRYQGCRLVFTTRQITFDSDVLVRFEHRPRESAVSRNILLSTAGFEGEPECPSALEAFHNLLRVGRGLPLRLALIGGGVWKTADLYNDIKRDEAWIVFNGGEVEDALIEEKDILLRSISYLDERGSEGLYYNCFRSLCLLRYAQPMPIHVVSRLWGMSKSEGRKIAEGLAEVNVVCISKRRTYDSNCNEMETVGMHDIMLDVARKEAQKDGSDDHYAFMLITSYLRKPDGEDSKTVCSRLMLYEKENIELGNDSEGFICTNNVTQVERDVYQSAASSEVDEVACDGWRTIKDDGYFYQNLYWLLYRAKLRKEPLWLIRHLNYHWFAQAEEDLRLTIQCTWDMSRLAVSEDAIRSVKLLKSAVAQRKADADISSWSGRPWFQMYGSMLCCANRSEWVRNYLQKIEQMAPRPWYKPSVGCLAPACNSVQTVLQVSGCLGCSLNDSELTYWSFASEAQREVEISKYSLSEECEKGKWILKSAEVDDWVDIVDCDIEEFACALASNASNNIPSSSTRKRFWRRESAHRGGKRRKDETHTEKKSMTICGQAGQKRMLDDETKILKLAFSKDNINVVACMSDGSVRLWNLQEEKWKCTAFTKHSDKVSDVLIGTDGTRFVGLSSEDVIRFWFKRKDGNWYSTISEEVGSIRFAEMSGDGNYVVLASYTGSSSIIYVLQLQEGGKLMKIEELVENVYDVAIDRIGSCISASLQNCTVYVWIYDGGNWRKTMLEGGASCPFAAINGDGNCVVMESRNGAVAWQLRAGTGTWHRKDLKGNRDVVDCIAVNEAGTFVSASSEWNIHVWEVPESMESPLLERDIVLEEDVSLSEPNNQIVGFFDKTVMIWELEEKKWKRTDLEHLNEVCFVGSNGSGTCVACGSWDGTLRMWRLENGEWRNIFCKTVRQPFFYMSSLNIYDAGSCVVAGVLLSSWNNGVLVLKLLDGEWQESELTGHIGDIKCVRVNEAGNLVVSGSEDNSVRLWELRDGTWDETIVGWHSDQVRGVAVNRNWTRILSVSDDGTVRLWVKKRNHWEDTILECDGIKCYLENVDISECEKFILCKTAGAEVFAWRQEEEKWEPTNSPNGEFSERWARQAACHRFPDSSQNEIIAEICRSSEGKVVYETRGTFFLTVPREPYLVRVDEIQ